MVETLNREVRTTATTGGVEQSLIGNFRRSSAGGCLFRSPNVRASRLMRHFTARRRRRDARHKSSFEGQDLKDVVQNGPQRTQPRMPHL